MTEDEIVRLEHRHQELEKRLAELMRHVALTPAEQAEQVQLKKEKLWVKDRMRAIDLAAAK